MSALSLAAAEDKSNHWAVLVAGSKGYGNYRHQADTCHAYQILKKNGIPEDQIIHMNYDDVAHSIRNPKRGKLFNKPTKRGEPGVDVYEGCKIDYGNITATSTNFYKVMLGEENGDFPVLKTNEDSKIFLYYADHGGPGIIGMPYLGGFNNTYIYADKLNDTLTEMKQKKMFKEMTMYVEACESGSMFQDILDPSLNVYAVTAANATQPSTGTYCGTHAMVDGVPILSCLGDLFSVNWMENSDVAEMSTETL